MARLYVSDKDESPRMFESNFLDFFSRVHFSVPLFVFVPVILYMMYYAIGVHKLPFLHILGWGGAGLLAWTFTEYFMHRFVFHFHPKSEFGKRIHFIFHGVHHDFPNDSYRLVLPPALSIPLALGFFTLFGYFFGDSPAIYPFFALYIFGYLSYDMMHYAIHHWSIKNKWFQAVKRHHMVHHFKDPDNGYGVSSTLWDHVLGTTYDKKK